MINAMISPLWSKLLGPKFDGWNKVESCRFNTPWLSRSIQLLLAIVVLVVTSSCGHNAIGSESKVDPSKAARSVSGSWFDRDKGTYIAPPLVPNRDNSIRKDGKLAEVGTEMDWSFLEAIRDLITSFFRAIGTIFYYFGYLLLALLVATLIAGVFYITAHFVRSYRGVSHNDMRKELTIDPAKIEDLPFEEMQSTNDPLGDCRSLAREGKFDEAIIYLYGYQLLAMDHARKIHLHKGKTNRMYLRELRNLDELKGIVELTIEKFELVYFGKRSLTKQSFLEVWNRLERFHFLIAQVENEPVKDSDPGLLPSGGVA